MTRFALAVPARWLLSKKLEANRRSAYRHWLVGGNGGLVLSWHRPKFELIGITPACTPPLLLGSCSCQCLLTSVRLGGFASDLLVQGDYTDRCSVRLASRRDYRHGALSVSQLL